MNYVTQYAAMPGMRMASLENPSISLADPAAWAEMFDDGDGSAAVTVSPRSALTYAAVWRGIGLLSDTVAKLSLVVRKRSGVNTENAPEHPAYFLLARKPNVEQTPFMWKRLLMFQSLMFGNSYSYVDRDKAGRPLGLIPLPNDSTWTERRKGQLWYRTTIEVGPQEFNTRWLYPEDVIHVRGLSEDGIDGLRWVGKAKESIGLGIGLRRYGTKFFENGAKASGVLMYPGTLSEKGQSNLIESFDKKYKGLSNSHKTILLEDGVKYQQLSVPNNEAQFLESRTFEIREIAIWLGVPPHKLGDSSRVAYNTLEQENQAFLTDTIDAWLVNIEQECSDKLLTTTEQREDTHFVAFDRSGLVRADMSARFSSYGAAVGGPFITADEARAAEGMNPLPNKVGESLLRPVNMQAVGETPAGNVDPTTTDFSVSPDAVQAVAADAVGRGIRRIVNETKAAATKPGFTAFCSSMGERFTAGLVQTIAPSAMLCGKPEGWAEARAKSLVEGLSKSLKECRDESAVDSYFASIIIPYEAAIVREIITTTETK